MLNTLLQVCLLIMGVGANASTPIKLDKQEETPIQQTHKLEFKNKANDTTENYSLIFSSQVQNTYSNTNTNPTIPTSGISQGDTPYYKAGKTVYAQVSNPALTINSISYASNFFVTGIGTQRYTKYGWRTDYYKDDRRGTVGYNAIRITPTLQTLDNTATLKSYTAIRINPHPNETLVLQNEIITTTSDKAPLYYDLNNYATQYALYDTFETLRETTANTATYQSIEHVITTSTDIQYIQDQIEVQIPKFEINNRTIETYIYIRSTVFLANQGGLESVLTTNLNPDIMPIAPATAHTITGAYIQANINYEVIDIPGIMWEILSMPFAFISQAFNLTLFPGTPYQVNISNLILMIFGILVFIFIFKLLIKK